MLAKKPFSPQCWRFTNLRRTWPTYNQAFSEATARKKNGKVQLYPYYFSSFQYSINGLKIKIGYHIKSVNQNVSSNQLGKENQFLLFQFTSKSLSKATLKFSLSFQSNKNKIFLQHILADLSNAHMLTPYKKKISFLVNS